MKLASKYLVPLNKSEKLYAKIYGENHKILMKDFAENPNKWGYIP